MFEIILLLKEVIQTSVDENSILVADALKVEAEAYLLVKKMDKFEELK